MAWWHQPEHQVKQPASQKTSWETSSPLPSYIEGAANTSRLWKSSFVCLPQLCALPKDARLADTVLPKQQSLQMRYPASPTGNSSGWAAASRQSKTLKHTHTKKKKSAAFLDRNNMAICHCSVSALNALEEFQIDKTFLLKMRGICAKNAWAMKWLFLVERQGFQHSMSHFLMGLWTQKHLLKMEYVCSAIPKVNATPVITQAPLNNF